MKKNIVLLAVIVLVVSVATGTLIYRQSLKNPYTMAWDMAAHTFYGAELAQDIRQCRPAAFLDHINDSSIALWPFMHPLILAIALAVFGFTDQVAVLLTVVFSILTVLTAFFASWLASDRRSAAPGLLAAFLLLTSPLYLGFSTYTMLEIFGAFFTLLTISFIQISKNSQSKSAGTMAAFAMLLLFLTKINYGLYLFVPYLIYEVISIGRERRIVYFDQLSKYLDLKNPKSFFNYLIFLIIVLIIFMNITGGIPFRHGGRTFKLDGTKNLIYLLLCLIFLKSVLFYYRHRRDIKQELLSQHLKIIHIVILPMFIWFLVNPGRLAEFVRMSSDRMTDNPLLSLSNLIYYPREFIIGYTCHLGVGIACLVLFVIAALRWKQNPPLINLLVVYVLFGYTGLTLKLHNFAAPRFFFTQAVAILFIAAFEIWHIGRFVSSLGYGSRSKAVYCSAITAILIVVAALPGRIIYTDQLPEILTESMFTGEPKLGRMVKETVNQIGPSDNRIAILGGSNEISPYLVQWELIKKYPSTRFVLIQPPVKWLDNERDTETFNNWLDSKPVDLIICIAISETSPFAQTTDFNARHAKKQDLVLAMKDQTTYERTSRERSKSRAVEVWLYKP